MRVLGIDQSLSKCAFCQMVDGIPTGFNLSKTGASKVKNKRKDTTYYDNLYSQIEHVCEDLLWNLETFKPEKVTFEALSFGSMGSASRDLACLYGAMRHTILTSSWEGEVTEIAPTSLKSYAHQYLPDDLKWDGVTKGGKPKKVKMDKKMMVAAAREVNGLDFLSEYNYSTGLDDLTDAYFLAHKTYHD